MSKHRHCIFWNGSRLPSTGSQGTKERTSILEDLWRVSSDKNTYPRNCNNHAAGDSFWVSFSVRTQNAELSLNAPVIQWSTSIRGVFTSGRMGHYSWPKSISGRPVRILLGMESERYWEKHGECEDFLGKAVRLFDDHDGTVLIP